MTEWRDPRLKFRDLKTNENLNTVNVEDIWYPHWEIPSNLKNSITSETYDTVVRKEGNFSKFNEKDDIIRVHIYDGSKNSIVLIQKNAKKIKRLTSIEKNKKIIDTSSGPSPKIKSTGIIKNTFRK